MAAGRDVQIKRDPDCTVAAEHKVLPAPKKWVLVHFKDDDSYTTVNTKTLAQRMEIEDTRARVKFPEGWFWGDILAQSGKVEIHEIFLPLSKYH